jgi:cupin fold WbuC family metalloprotein
MEKLDFIYNYIIPNLPLNTRVKYFNEAKNSKKKRFSLVIHKQGDEFNQVFNFICSDSYMKPHFHPKNMIENMHLIEGSFELFLFDKKGKIIKTYLLDRPGQRVQVPALQFHTYVMKSDLTIVYETMVGKYNPLTWKKMANWAPDEKTEDSIKYFQTLKNFKS